MTLYLVWRIHTLDTYCGHVRREILHIALTEDDARDAIQRFSGVDNDTMRRTLLTDELFVGPFTFYIEPAKLGDQ